MQQNEIGTVTQVSANSLDERIAQLKELFPEAFTEDKVDFDRLRAALGDLVDDDPERYTFTWAGKRDAIRLLQTPTRATLIPCREVSVNFDETHHIFIEGDNLEVLKLLYKPYFGRVRTIYIDPPYNTGQDFIYSDNYADPLATYLQLTGQQDEIGNLLTSNPETSGRYHSAWLSMMYPRLFLARQLLREDGFMIVSIDDHELYNLRLLMNEIFGEENFVANVVWEKAYTANMTARFVSDTHDHLVVYARNADSATVGRLDRSKDQIAKFTNPDNDPRGPWKAENLSAGKYYAAGQFEIVTPSGRKVKPPPGRYWRCNEETYKQWLSEGRITFGRSGKGRPMLKKYLSEVQEGLTPSTWWTHKDCGSNKEASIELKTLFNGSAVFDTPKPVKLLRRIIKLFSDEDGIILDFFAGSCTVAHAVLEQNRTDGGNRRFIMVQLPEPTGNPQLPTIADIGKERIHRVITRMQEEQAGQLPLETRKMPEDLGFKAFKLTPSNYQLWDGVDAATPEAYAGQMELFTDPLVDGWMVENIIYEVALKEGYGLNCRIEVLPAVPGNTVYSVTDPDREQFFYICLDNAISLDNLNPLNLDQDDLFVCRDAALDDEAAANLALQCRLKTI